MQAAKTFRVATLGCKVNQYETQLVAEALQRAGFREAFEREPADLCFVNTCTVTENADSRGRQVVRQSFTGQIGDEKSSSVIVARKSFQLQIEAKRGI